MLMNDCLAGLSLIAFKESHQGLSFFFITEKEKTIEAKKIFPIPQVGVLASYFVVAAPIVSLCFPDHRHERIIRKEETNPTIKKLAHGKRVPAERFLTINVIGLSSTITRTLLRVLYLLNYCLDIRFQAEL